MTDDPAISALHNSLKQIRDARQSEQARISRLETELKQSRAKDAQLAVLEGQTENALYQALSFRTNEPPPHQPMPQPPVAPPQYDMEITSPGRQMPPYQNPYPQSSWQAPREPLREDRYSSGYSMPAAPPMQYPAAQDHSQAYPTERIEEQIARARREEQSSNVRFNDFRIPQAATIVLREAGQPMHVNEIYRRMANGGFEFRGQHQLITLAVSLSRSKRFRKVSPGTFELSPEFLAGQVA
jgi:hypothetical protein